LLRTFKLCFLSCDLDQVDPITDQIFEGLLAWGVEPRSDYEAKPICLVVTVENYGLFQEKLSDAVRVDLVSLEVQTPVDPLYEHLI
jgi:hypothetical protein